MLKFGIGRGRRSMITTLDAINLVDNGSFDDLSGWSFYKFDGVDTAADPTVGSVVAGKLRLTVASGSLYPVGVYPLATVNGRTYRLRVEARNPSAGVPAYIRVSQSSVGFNIGTVYDSGDVLAPTPVNIDTTFVATGPLYLALFANGEVVGEFAEYDNVIVNEG